MKKLLALVLAMTMVLSLGAVAFATSSPTTVKAVGIFTAAKEYNKDTQTMVPADAETTTFYYEIAVGTALSDATNFAIDMPISKADAGRLKVKLNLIEGKPEVKDASVVGKIINARGSKSVHYFIEVKLANTKDNWDPMDVIGTVEVFAGSGYSVVVTDESGAMANTGKNKKVASFNVGYVLPAKAETEADNSTLNDGYYTFTDEEAKDIALGNGLGRFVVDTTSADKKIYVKLDVKYTDDAIEAYNPDVAFTYYTSNNPRFHKIGELYIDASATDVVYKVASNGTLSKLNVPYDEYEEAYIVRTRSIGSYVVAEKELDIAKINAKVLANAGEVVAPGADKPANPSTGVIC